MVLTASTLAGAHLRPEWGALQESILLLRVCPAQSKKQNLRAVAILAVKQQYLPELKLLIAAWDHSALLLRFGLGSAKVRMSQLVSAPATAANLVPPGRMRSKQAWVSDQELEKKKEQASLGVGARASASAMRYLSAQQQLFGQNLDVASRFDAKKEEDMGIMLLEKIWSLYQDCASAKESPPFTIYI